MSNETKRRTETEADMINYDYFSYENATRYMALVEEYPHWDKDEIIRVEVRNQMFRELSVNALYEYFNPLYGWTKETIKTQKRIIQTNDQEVK